MTPKPTPSSVQSSDSEATKLSVVSELEDETPHDFAKSLVGHTPAGYLRLKEFAKMIPCSIDSVRRAVWDGLFTPAIVGGIGRGRPHLFLPSQAQAFRDSIVAHREDVQLYAESARIAAELERESQITKVCLLLAQGRPLQAIVIELQMNPDVVELAAEKWARLSRGFYVGGDIIVAIEKLPLDGPIPIRVPNDLVEVLRIASTQNRCACGKEPKSIGVRCARAAVAKTKALRTQKRQNKSGAKKDPGRTADQKREDHDGAPVAHGKSPT